MCGNKNATFEPCSRYKLWIRSFFIILGTVTVLDAPQYHHNSSISGVTSFYHRLMQRRGSPPYRLRVRSSPAKFWYSTQSKIPSCKVWYYLKFASIWNPKCVRNWKYYFLSIQYSTSNEFHMLFGLIQIFHIHSICNFTGYQSNNTLCHQLDVMLNTNSILYEFDKSIF